MKAPLSSPADALRVRSLLTFPAIALVLLVQLVVGPLAHAYDLLGCTWPSGNIPMRLQLDSTATSLAFPLLDGSTSWNSVAQASLNDWNPNLSRSKFTFTTSSASAANNQFDDGISQVFFATSIYGEEFDARTLAVTKTESGFNSIRATESDVLVNKNFLWNAYRGALRGSYDLRRVLTHEFGHVLGLNHPDQAKPVQNIAAIMNSTISDIDSLQPDDLAGVRYLYNTPFKRPTITTQPTNQTAAVGSPAKFTVAVDGQDPPSSDDFHSTEWYYKAPGAAEFELLFTLVTPGSLVLPSVQLEDAGSYYFSAITPDDTVKSGIVTLTTTPATISPTSQLANLSTRGIGGASPGAMTVGFVVTGPRSKFVLLRSAGPALAAFGVPGTLADPQLVLKNSSGTTVATSTAIWDQGANVADIRDASTRVGAFALTAGSRDAVLLLSLAPGNYTATTTSPSGSSGTVLIEVYDADLIRDVASRIANLSTRGFVSTGADTLIAGFVVQGPGPRTYLLRVTGESLKSFGVTSVLADPYLKLFTGLTLLREKDDWDSPAASQPALNTAFNQVGAFLFPYPSTVNGVRLPTATQPAMLVTLAPGSYTAQATGLDNHGSTDPSGNALIEIYELP